MCWKKPFAQLSAMSPRNHWRLGLFAAACLVLGFGIGHGCNTAAKTMPAAVTQQQADAALHWLSGKMPNTVFTAARPDVDAPALVQMTARDSPAPLYFDPVHHYLTIGLVVNLDNPNQRIAGGHLAGNSAGAGDHIAAGHLGGVQ